MTGRGKEVLCTDAEDGCHGNLEAEHVDVSGLTDLNHGHHEVAAQSPKASFGNTVPHGFDVKVF